MIKRISLFLLLILPFFMHAQSVDRYRLNGFASIRASVDDVKKTDDSPNVDYKSGSLAGLQLTGYVSDRSRVTMVITAIGDDNFELSLDWFYYTYVLPSDWLINVGRIGTPFYLYSDINNVRFSYDWMELPESVYWLTYSGIEGVNFYHNDMYLDFNTTFQLVHGGFDDKTSVGGVQSNTVLKDLIGVVGSIERNGLYIRTTFVKANVDVQVASLNAVFDLLPSEFVDGFWFNKVDAYFRGVAIRYQRGDWQLLSEVTSVKIVDSFFGDRDGGYISVTRAFGDLRPFVMVEYTDFDIKEIALTPYRTFIPPPLYSELEVLSEFEHQRDIRLHVGARYDHSNKLSFKIQYTQEHDKRRGDRVRLLSLGVDVVF